MFINKKIITIIISCCLIIMISFTIYADEKYDINVNEVLKTNRTESEFDSSFFSVTGYAKGNVKDRSKYIDTKYYRVVSNADEFVQAIEDARDGNVKVIEVNNDINLGYYELSEESQNARCVELYAAPSNTNYKSGTYTNPTIRQSGVTKLSISSTDGLTIFSKTGNCIRHVEFKLQYGSNDIVFRNLEFDDMWQWDERGNHKEVGWSFFKINGAKNVWIDHCTFSIAADALIDLENASSGVTYSWCRFSKEAKMPQKCDPIYKTITYMEYKYQNNMVNVAGRYAQMRNSGISPEAIMKYESFHSKCFGVGNEKQFKDMGSGNMPEDSSQRVRLTMAYNYLTNVGQRIPRLSFGRVHIFNMLVDNEGHEKLGNSDKQLKSLGGNSLRANLCINVHAGGSCAADTCIFNYVEKPIAGHEYQGEYGGTGLSADKVLSHCWRDAKNRALIINSKVVDTKGHEYIGSSWDNNGENPFLEKDYWEIGAGQSVEGEEKSTLGDWAWATNIVGVENMSREEPPDTTFVFADDYDAKLSYSYKTLPLEKLEDTLKNYAGAYKLNMSEKQWLKTEYSAKEKIKAFSSKKKILVEKLNIRQKSQIVYKDELFQLDADVLPGNASNKNVIWTSSNSNIMEILDSGLVIVKQTGVVTISAVAMDTSGVEASIELVSQEKPEETLKPSATEPVQTTEKIDDKYDVNNDGDVNALDALIVLQATAKKEKYDSAYDVDGNKFADAIDALLILRYIAEYFF